MVTFGRYTQLLFFQMRSSMLGCHFGNPKPNKVSLEMVSYVPGTYVHCAVHLNRYSNKSHLDPLVLIVPPPNTSQALKHDFLSH